MNELEYVNCNLCGRDDTTQLYQIEKLSIVQCNHCGLVYTNPRLSEAEMIKLYEVDYFVSKNKDYLDYIKDTSTRYIMAQLRLKGISKYKKPPGKMLEIGCATGIFLDVARRKGWDTSGVEISDFAGHYAREKFGLDVFIGQLEDADFPPESFDVICMFQVLEHIPSPKKLCQMLYSLLKPDGLLVIEVPDFSSPVSERLKEKWACLIPEMHLYHFSRKSLNNLLIQTKYKIIGVSLWGGRGLGLLWNHKTRPGLAGIPKRLVIRYLPYLGWLRRGILFIKTRLFKQSEYITVYARKE